MRCPEIRAFLHPFLDGELEVEKNVVVLQHLDLCGCCRDRFEDEKRLLTRCREAISERCPEELRAKLLAACAGSGTPAMTASPTSEVSAVPSHRVRHPGRILTRRRLLVGAATFAIAFLGIDPFCLRGCSTVKALAAEYRSLHDGALPLSDSDPGFATKLGKLSNLERVECPRMGCGCCPRCGSQIACEGGTRIECHGEAGCLIRYRDHKNRVVAFMQTRARVHPWLLGSDGLYVARQNDCCLVGWNDKDGGLCAFVADSALPVEELLTIACKVRADELAGR